MGMFWTASNLWLIRMLLFVLISGLLSPALGQTTTERVYRASAYVTILSVPIFSRSNVGYAVVTEHIDELTHSVELAFVGGTIPERAHGLNRFGYMRELVEDQDGLPMRATYAGVITKDAEQSLKDAKQSLNGTEVNSVICSAANGQITGTATRSDVWQTRISAPRDPRPDDVLHLAQSVLTSAPQSAEHRVSTMADASERTFLYSVRQSMRSGARFTRAQFLHNSRTLTLRTEKHLDARAGRELQQSGLCIRPDKVMQLTGIIENDTTGERSEFVVWFEKGDSLPLRFSYRPRPYLRLVFDAEPTTTLPKPDVASTIARRQ